MSVCSIGKVAVHLSLFSIRQFNRRHSCFFARYAFSRSGSGSELNKLCTHSARKLPQQFSPLCMPQTRPSCHTPRHTPTNSPIAASLSSFRACHASGRAKLLSCAPASRAERSASVSASQPASFAEPRARKRFGWRDSLTHMCNGAGRFS